MRRLCRPASGLSMNPMKSCQKIALWLGTLCAVLIVGSVARPAEEAGLAAAPVKAAVAPPGYKGPIEYEGKVVVVNRAEQTITVDLNGKLYLFKMTPQVRIFRKGKPVRITDVTAGQKIRLVARRLDDGSLELATAKSLGAWLGAAQDNALQLASAEPESPAALPTPRRAPTEQKPGEGPRHLPPPFQGGYFPGHVEKVVVSPHN